MCRMSVWIASVSTCLSTQTSIAKCCLRSGRNPIGFTDPGVRVHMALGLGSSSGVREAGGQPSQVMPAFRMF